MSNRNGGRVLLEITDLKKHFPVLVGFLRKHVGDVKAVDGVTFNIHAGETFGLVGESGCGKTTLGRVLVRAYEPTSGEMLLHDDTGILDLSQLGHSELRAYWKKAQLIFQDPYSSLNPRKTVLQIIGEPLMRLERMGRREREGRVRELLEIVGLDPRYAERYPHAFSGGQRQRIGIARALAVSPELIVADEPVSALDVSIQAQVINLLQDLQERFHLTVVLISHDLGVVKHTSTRVAVMYVGQIVEVTETQRLFREPKHPYTEALLSAVPQPATNRRINRVILKGDAADPANRPAGCSFHPRCQYAEARCVHEEPRLQEVGTAAASHLVACHLAEKLSLRGVLDFRAKPT